MKINVFASITILYYYYDMSITRDEVKHIAKLARIELTKEEVTRFQADLNKVLGYVEVLKTVDTADVEPLATVTGLENVLREDYAEESAQAHEEEKEAILENAPARQGRLFRVKKVF